MMRPISWKFFAVGLLVAASLLVVVQGGFHNHSRIAARIASLGVAAGGQRLAIEGENLPELLHLSLQPDLANRHLLVGNWQSWGDIEGIALQGDFAYLVDREFGLLVIDISDPRKPVLLRTLELPWPAWKIAINGTRGAISSPAFGLMMVDFGIPGEPRLVTTFKVPGRIQDLVFAGSRILATDYDGGLEVIEALNPEKPDLLGTIATPGRPYRISVDGETAVVACLNGGVMLFDLAVAGLPRPTGTVTLAHDVAVAVKQGDLLAVGYTKGAGVELFRLDRGVPVETQRFIEIPQVRDMMFFKGVLYLACSDGVRAILDPLGGTEQSVAFMESRRGVFTLACDMDWLFLVGREIGLQIVQRSELEWSFAPRAGAGERFVKGIAQAGDYLALAGTPFGLRTAKEIGGGGVEVISELFPSWQPVEIAAFDGGALVARSDGGVELFRADDETFTVTDRWLKTDLVVSLKLVGEDHALLAERNGRFGFLQFGRDKPAGVSWFSPIPAGLASADCNSRWVVLADAKSGLWLVRRGQEGGGDGSRRYHPVPDKVRSVAIAGDELFVLTFPGDLFHYRILKDGAIERLPGLLGKEFQRMALGESAVYLATGSGELSILDIPSGTETRHVLPFTGKTLKWVFGLEVESDRLFIASGDGIMVLSLEEPLQPRLLSRRSDIFDMERIATAGGLLWGGARTTGSMTLLKVSEAGELDFVRDWLLDGRFVRYIESSRTLLLADADGLTVVDADNPHSLRLVEHRHLGWNITGLVVTGDSIVVTDGAQGVFVFNLDEQRHLRQTSHVPLEGVTEGVTAFNRFILVPRGTFGVSMLQLSESAQASLRATVALPEPLARFATARDIAIGGDYAYVAQGLAGVQVLEVDAAGGMSTAGLFETDGYARDVEVDSGHLHVADSFGGVLVYDLENPIRPILEDVIDVSGTARGIHVKGRDIWVLSPLRRVTRPLALEVATDGSSGGVALPASLGEGWFRVRVLSHRDGIVWDGFLENKGGQVAVRQAPRSFMN